MKALCCLYGFLLEGFIPSGLVGHLHTVLVTIPSRIWCYGVVVFDFEPPWVTAYRFPPGRGLVLCYWSLHSWLWWLLCQEACFRVGFYYMALHFYISIIQFLGKPRGLCPACSRCYYWPVRSLCSSVHNLSYLV
jgi:hypothetical protein